MWEEIGLLGRDQLLSKHIIPRLRGKTGFVLLGQHGIGKSALLGWCIKYAAGKKSLISATWPAKQMMEQICKDWELEPEGKTIADLYRAILAEQGHWLMIDDIQRVTPAALQKIKPIRDRHLLVCAGIPPIRKDELKRLLWGLKYIEVGHINNTDMKRLANAAAPLLATKTPIVEAVHAARGIPAVLFHALRGEVTPETAKTKDEEIDISPLLLIAVAGVMGMRYIARGMDSPSLYMLSGLGTAALVIGRFYLFRGMKR